MKKRFLYVIPVVAFLVMTLISCVTSTIESKKPLWESGIERNKIVVCSDIHLGIDDAYAENVQNRQYLVDFLEQLAVTKDVREVVLNGDILDEWFLPLSYIETDRDEFYGQVISNNLEVIDAFKKVINSGIKLVYVVGNHDMSVNQKFIEKVIPGIEISSDRLGLGLYRTGDRNEIAIEHGHRYDIYSAPDTITNAEITEGDTMFPPGYFYARYAADWVITGKPKFVADIPAITTIPDRNTNPDQFSAYAYYKILDTEFNRITLGNAFDDKIFDMRIDGYNDKYSVKDMFPVLNEKGEISAPVLFPNYQRTWDYRQEVNGVKIKTDFSEAALGALSRNYYESQARMQFDVDKKESPTDIVVFGHTHIPEFYDYGNGHYYINTGTWIDHNVNYKEQDGSYLSRTFTVITTGKQDIAELFQYETDGTLRDIKSLIASNHLK